jgi:hypothetical protein
MQVVLISSDKCGWRKQGSCKVIDDEPTPPDDPSLTAPEGWKEVTAFKAVNGGGDYLFPKDQLLLVMLDMKQPDIEVKYKKIEFEGHRHLSKLKQDKNYLVWFHHLWRPADLKAKRSKSK